MTAYIKLSTLEYPRHEGDIRIEHPEISETQTGASFPCPETYAPVQWTSPPVVDLATHAVSQGTPEFVDGIWKATWTTRALTQQELDMLAEMANKSLPPNLNTPGAAPDVIE